MATEVTVVVNHEAITALPREEWYRNAAINIADAIAAGGRATAPRSTIPHRGQFGHGADSIRGEPVLAADGWQIHVSWDVAHSYMALQRSHAIQEAAHEITGT